MPSHRRAVAFPAGLSPSLATASGVIALTVVAVDQATKALVRWVLPLCSPSACNGVHAGPFVFVNRTNPGAAFGIGAASTACVLLAATSCLLIPPLGARLSAAGANRGTVALTLGLLTGGAVGNLADRIVFGAVTDFLIPGGHVVLNLADVAVMAGMAMTIGLLVRNRSGLAPARISRTTA